MLYMIQIWCPPPNALARGFAADWKQSVFIYSSSGQAPQLPWSVLLVSGRALVIIGDNGPAAGNTTSPRQRLRPAPPMPPACSRRQPGLDINDAGVRSAPSGSATPRCPQSQPRHIQAPGKKTKTKRQLQFCRVTAKTVLWTQQGFDGTGNWHREHAGRWHFQWFHQRMPKREQRAQPLALY